MPGNSLELYDSIGGAQALAAIIERLYARALTDPKLDAYFTHVPLVRLKIHQAAFMAQISGGPAAYRGRSLLDAHAASRLTNGYFDRMALHLREALTESAVVGDQTEVMMDRIGRFRRDVVSTASAAREA